MNIKELKWIPAKEDLDRNLKSRLFLHLEKIGLLPSPKPSNQKNGAQGSENTPNKPQEKSLSVLYQKCQQENDQNTNVERLVHGIRDFFKEEIEKLGRKYRTDRDGKLFIGTVSVLRLTHECWINSELDQDTVFKHSLSSIYTELANSTYTCGDDELQISFIDLVSEYYSQLMTHYSEIGEDRMDTLLDDLIRIIRHMTRSSLNSFLTSILTHLNTRLLLIRDLPHGDLHYRERTFISKLKIIFGATITTNLENLVIAHSRSEEVQNEFLSHLRTLKERPKIYFVPSFINYNSWVLSCPPLALELARAELLTLPKSLQTCIDNFRDYRRRNWDLTRCNRPEIVRWMHDHSTCEVKGLFAAGPSLWTLSFWETMILLHFNKKDYSKYYYGIENLAPGANLKELRNELGISEKQCVVAIRKLVRKNILIGCENEKGQKGQKRVCEGEEEFFMVNKEYPSSTDKKKEEEEEEEKKKKKKMSLELEDKLYADLNFVRRRFRNSLSVQWNSKVKKKKLESLLFVLEPREGLWAGCRVEFLFRGLKDYPNRFCVADISLLSHLWHPDFPFFGFDRTKNDFSILISGGEEFLQILDNGNSNKLLYHEPWENQKDAELVHSECSFGMYHDLNALLERIERLFCAEAWVFEARKREFQRQRKILGMEMRKAEPVVTNIEAYEQVVNDVDGFRKRVKE